MRPMHARRARGFTLVELMITLAVVSIVVAMAMVAVMSQQEMLQSRDLARAANASMRDALFTLETSLRHTGFGVEPRLAIDTQYLCPTGAASCRDSKTGPDELVVLERNGNYRWVPWDGSTCTMDGGCFFGNAWPITEMVSNILTVAVHPGETVTWQRGQLVLATCAAGAEPRLLRLDSRVQGSGSVPLGPGGMTPTSDPYNAWGALQPCHGQPGAAVFLVERRRYFIQNVGGTPWLMLDPGVDVNGDNNLPPADTADLTPLARGVEDMQVAYVLAPGPAANQPSGPVPPPDSNGNWVLGDDPAAGPEAPQFVASTPANPAVDSPTYKTPRDHVSRADTHAANVRAIRVSLTFRSHRSDPTRPKGWAGDSVPGAENRGGQLSGGGFHRYVISSQISLRNMDSRDSFIF